MMRMRYNTFVHEALVPTFSLGRPALFSFRAFPVFLKQLQRFQMMYYDYGTILNIETFLLTAKRLSSHFELQSIEISKTENEIFSNSYQTALPLNSNKLSLPIARVSAMTQQNYQHCSTMVRIWHWNFTVVWLCLEHLSYNGCKKEAFDWVLLYDTRVPTCLRLHWTPLFSFDIIMSELSNL